MACGNRPGQRLSIVPTLEEWDGVELRHLRYFVMVAEHLHFGRAAAQLNMAQPPLSQQIRRLEEELGVALFKRDRHRVELTSAGAHFLEHARSVLHEAERSVQVARQASRGEFGRLVIGHAPPADLKVLPAILSRFRKKYPHVALQLRSLSGQHLVNAVVDRLVQVAVLRLPCSHKALRVEEILREPLIAVLPSGHPLAQQERVSLRGLARETFILFRRPMSPEYYDLIANFCLRQGGFMLSDVQESETIQTTLGLVSAGLGVSLQPESVTSLGRAGVAYRPLLERSPLVAIGIAYWRDEQPETVKAFVDIARAMASTGSSPATHQWEAHRRDGAKTPTSSVPHAQSRAGSQSVSPRAEQASPAGARSTGSPQSKPVRQRPGARRV